MLFIWLVFLYKELKNQICPTVIIKSREKDNMDDLELAFFFSDKLFFYRLVFTKMTRLTIDNLN